jgi:hypothetical protein
MKTTKIIFWTTTSLIFLFEGVLPALTGHTEMAKQGISHLGFPDYFRVQLNILKVLGSLAIILPMVPARIKEWAYFGLGITLVSAIVAHGSIDGVNAQTFFPLIPLVILMVSYISYHKINSRNPIVA